ncbi:hypothetical protein K501DRAFT_328786 [Backusella circina FSU 941]|nr:hypothetical protein K501DRAFT_328786 [Backusella circina FSU 941]
MSINSLHFSEKSEYDDELKSSEFERFQKGMKADFSRLIDEVQHFPQQKRNTALKEQTHHRLQKSLNLKQEEEEEEEVEAEEEEEIEVEEEEETGEEDYDNQTEDVWTDDIASSIETGMPHPDIDGISFHSDIDIYGDLVDGEENRSSSDSWERHLDDVDDNYKLRPPRKKTSGSVISVQSVGNYFLSKSFPVSEFDEVLDSQRTTESHSIDELSEVNEMPSYQVLLQSRFSQLPNKLHEKTQYNTQQASFPDEHTSQHENSISTPEIISISEDMSSPSSPIPPISHKEFKYAIYPESFLFECRFTNKKWTTKKRATLNIYNPNPAMSITYRLDAMNDLLLFSSLSGSIPEQSQKAISMKLNIDSIKQQQNKEEEEEEVQSLSDRLLVFIDDLPPSELEVIISMDPDMDLSDRGIRRGTADVRKEQIAAYDVCCKLCNIERETELHIE